MIDKPLGQIEFADVERFVAEKWSESKTVEYKRESYGRTDDKLELLKDVSSFANTQGGDILIGVEEADGLPTTICGITIADPDQEILRLEGIIRQGLEPRIDFEIRHVKSPAGISILIIRIAESILIPHRVVFHGKFGEFWARSSAGKYSMDTNELRQAFTLSESINERMRQFREDRLQKVMSFQTPVPLMAFGRFVLHLVPISAFRSRQQVNVVGLLNQSPLFPPISTGSRDRRLNLDGLASFGGGNSKEGCRAYTLLFRNATLESVLTDIVRTEGERVVLFETDIEHELTQQDQVFRQYLTGFRTLGIGPPIWVFMSLLGVKNAKISTKNVFRSEQHAIDRDMLLLPEVVINDLNQRPIDILRPLFDLIWNAAGYPGSFNFDENNNWVDR